jgi:hypothetical protein|tara:strand:- start:429 stop:1283 length:855 start_codon:yes stop_codon:yes gene_type:complete
MAIERVHSSDIQVFVNGERIPAINSLSVNTEKELVDIPRLGVSHISDRVLASSQSSSLDMGLLITTGASGIDPFYQCQMAGSGFLNTGKFDFQIKDTVGVTTVSGASMTSYSLNGSVGALVEGSTAYEGDAAIFTPDGALTFSDSTSDTFGGFFRPQNIEISTTPDGLESISSASFNIQNFTLSVDTPRKKVTRLGTRTPKFRYPDLPSQGSLSFSAVKNQVTGIDLSSLVCQSGVIKIDLKDNEGNSVMDFTTSGCCLESIDESTDLDDNTSVDFSYYFPILK